MSNLSLVPPGPEAAGADGRSGSHQQPRRQADPAPEAETAPAPDPGQRLIIEENGEGQLVYTVYDRASGSVVAQTSREEVTRMGLRSDYAAGSLIRAKA